MQTGGTNNAAEIVVVVTGMAAVFLGLMQYLSKFMKSNETRRAELFSELEKTKLNNVELQGLLKLREMELLEARNTTQKYRTLYKGSTKKYMTVDTSEMDALIETLEPDEKMEA